MALEVWGWGWCFISVLRVGRAGGLCRYAGSWGLVVGVFIAASGGDCSTAHPTAVALALLNEPFGDGSRRRRTWAFAGSPHRVRGYRPERNPTTASYHVSRLVYRGVEKEAHPVSLSYRYSVFFSAQEFAANVSCHVKTLRRRAFCISFSGCLFAVPLRVGISCVVHIPPGSSYPQLSL